MEVAGIGGISGCGAACAGAGNTGRPILTRISVGLVWIRRPSRLS